MSEFSISFLYWYYHETKGGAEPSAVRLEQSRGHAARQAGGEEERPRRRGQGRARYPHPQRKVANLGEVAVARCYET